ncbi:MAG: hypothetical protein A2W22_04805 [Candidatus Levybacteria bacterium RBG_16_35_11]|nr:MAG: hypothetical protein A2W22_04805 [Candidatus Levybacteria bacterium RBG_16_35_11]
MTIGKVEFEGGYPIDPRADVEEFVKDLLIQNVNRITILPEGEYDLTPRRWKHNNYKHSITVFDNGKGVLRMIPIHKDSGTIELTPEGGQFKTGGRNFRLPEDFPYAVVAGGIGGGKVGIHEIVVYIPDLSPKPRPT